MWEWLACRRQTTFPGRGAARKAAPLIWGLRTLDRATIPGLRLLRGLFVGINQSAGALIGRRDHGLIAHAAPGLEIGGVGEAVILHLQHAGFGPLAILAELEVAHDGLELVGAEIFGELVVVERAGAGDG